MKIFLKINVKFSNILIKNLVKIKMKNLLGNLMTQSDEKLCMNFQKLILILNFSKKRKI